MVEIVGPDYDVIIAGSGPIACTYANTILKERPRTSILMIEIGSQEHPTPGANLKNALKYQKDIDAFVGVIKSALQPVSIPPAESYVATLGGTSWHPDPDKNHQFHGCNPDQKAHNNLRASAITRTVGGMATHWTCCCPRPEESEERGEGARLIPEKEFDALFDRAGKLLSVSEEVFDETKSIRHKAVKKALTAFKPGNLPLGVKSTATGVIWSGSDTILGDAKVKLLTEHRVTRLVPSTNNKGVGYVEVHNYATNDPLEKISAHAFVIACGAICTPQILWNSVSPICEEWTEKMRPKALGRRLCEQSLAFCQVVLSKTIIDEIWPNYSSGGTTVGPEYKEKFEKAIQEHKQRYPKDQLPIPFNDPDPQVYLKYIPKDPTKNDLGRPWHVQVHRDAFSYGEVGPKVDSRVVVDLRFFGRSDINEKNRVMFKKDPDDKDGWKPKYRDIYGMPQPKFKVVRSGEDKERDQRMMEEMCKVATKLGGYLPGSYPQFMEPGLAQHITGTTRMGEMVEESVVDKFSQVHGVKNLWLGGNGVIPDSMACNPTRTSMAYAIKGAEALVKYLESLPVN